MKHKTLITIVVLCVLFVQNSFAQTGNIVEAITRSFSKDKPVYNREALGLLLADRIPEAVIAYSEAIDLARNDRTVGSGIDGDLIGEYAYALALNHDFEAALVNIDRSRALSAVYKDFYASQVLFIMGFNNASAVLGARADIPPSMAGSYAVLSGKYAMRAHVSGLAPSESLTRANQLAARGQSIQAIALYEELMEAFPAEPLIFISASTVWESLGQYEYASLLLGKGISLTPQTANTRDRVATLNSHLYELNHVQHQAQEPQSWFKENVIGDQPPRLMAYGGSTIASGMFSLNARLGMMTSKQYSASLNTGLNFSGGSMSGSIGISAYKTWNVFVFGAGINDMFSKGSNVLSLSPSVGLSFPDKDRSSSFDIMLNLYVPFSSKASMNYSLSIGKTFYFDYNLKKR